MFGSLIRRKTANVSSGPNDPGFESTTVSLSTAVPRPVERRSHPRLDAMLRVCKLAHASGEQQLIKVKNMSAGGMMAIVPFPPQVGDQVKVEVSGQNIPSTIVWIRDDMVGIKYDEDVVLGELLAGRKERHGFRARPPRLEIRCNASVRVGSTYYTVEVHDISMGGMKVEPIAEYCVGKQVTIGVQSLKPIKGEVRWYSDRRAGIIFDKSLEFDELAEWVGKRLELASLKASFSSYQGK